MNYEDIQYGQMFSLQLSIIEPYRPRDAGINCSYGCDTSHVTLDKDLVRDILGCPESRGMEFRLPFTTITTLPDIICEYGVPNGTCPVRLNGRAVYDAILKCEYQIKSGSKLHTKGEAIAMLESGDWEMAVSPGVGELMRLHNSRLEAYDVEGGYWEVDRDAIFTRIPKWVKCEENPWLSEDPFAKLEALAED